MWSNGSSRPSLGRDQGSIPCFAIIIIILNSFTIDFTRRRTAVRAVLFWWGLELGRWTGGRCVLHGFSRDRSENSRRLNFLPGNRKAAFSRGSSSGVGAELHRGRRQKKTRPQSGDGTGAAEGRRRELIGGGLRESCTRTGTVIGQKKSPRMIGGGAR